MQKDTCVKGLCTFAIQYRGKQALFSTLYTTSPLKQHQYRRGKYRVMSLFIGQADGCRHPACAVMVCEVTALQDEIPLHYAWDASKTNVSRTVEPRKEGIP